MLKNEKGSITVFVLVVMLFFTIILMGVLVTSNNSKKNQKTAETTIIDKYQKDVDIVDIIYNEKLQEFESLNHTDIAEVKWNSTINETNSTASATINFYENDLSKISNFKYFVNTSKSFVGKNAEEWNTAQTVNSGISANGTLTPLSIQNRKTNFVHVLINYSDNHQIEIVSNALKYNSLLAGKLASNNNRDLSGSTDINEMSYKNPVIPQGFKAVDVGDATWTYTDDSATEVSGWNNGLVIESDDNIGNQFVWVPCVTTATTGVTTYERAAFTTGSNVTNSNTSDATDTSGTYKAIPVVDETAQIRTYQGFYVARYEAGNTTLTLSASSTSPNNTISTPVSIKGAKVWNHIDYTNAYKSANTMINNSETYGSTKSGLITGKQWDTIMSWYKNSNPSIGVEKSTQNWGTYRTLQYTIPKGAEYFTYGSSAGSWTPVTADEGVSHNGNSSYSISASTPLHYHTSGANTNGYKKNISDMAGNVWEWSAEVYSSGRVCRGGGAWNGEGDTPASYRYNYNTTDANLNTGFRCVLYVQ